MLLKGVVKMSIHVCIQHMGLCEHIYEYYGGREKALECLWKSS